jgi:hypothetical protein
MGPAAGDEFLSKPLFAAHGLAASSDSEGRKTRTAPTKNHKRLDIDAPAGVVSVWYLASRIIVAIAGAGPSICMNQNIGRNIFGGKTEATPARLLRSATSCYRMIGLMR